MFEFLVAVGGMVVSFYLLAVICEEFFVPSLDEISKRLGLSSDVAGATFMAVGSSAPELFTSLFAVFKPGDHADVGAGTIVGSAIFNILVIIGASAAFKAVKLNWQPVVRDTFFYVLTILLLLWSFWDGHVTLFEALVFVGMYVAYIVAVTNWKKFFPFKDADPIQVLEEGIEKEVKKNKLAFWSQKVLGFIIPDCRQRPELFIVTFLASVGLIAAMSYSLVESAVVMGDFLNINPTFIALTVLAAGTSIPDLLSSIIVAKQGRGDMAVSNAVGSNVFDILFGLGFPWMLVLLLKGGTVAVSTDNLLSSVFLLFATVIAIFFLLLIRNWRIGHRSGWLLIGLYGLYVVYVFMTVVA